MLVASPVPMVGRAQRKRTLQGGPQASQMAQSQPAQPPLPHALCPCRTRVLSPLLSRGPLANSYMTASVLLRKESPRGKAIRASDNMMTVALQSRGTSFSLSMSHVLWKTYPVLFSLSPGICSSVLPEHRMRTLTFNVRATYESFSFCGIYASMDEALFLCYFERLRKRLAHLIIT